MKASNTVDSWTIFGVGNFIFDILDAINANNENATRIVTNMQIDAELARRLPIKIETIDDFRPSTNEKYIFGFLNPNKDTILELLQTHNLVMSNLIHPKAYIAQGTVFGAGNYFGAGVVIGPQTKIGRYNYFNRGVLIGHDVKITDNNHFGPGAIICGRCVIASRNNFGAGSVVNDNISVCSDCTIGSSSAVVKKINKKGLYIGLPAKLKHS